jgi:hypothetical protein
VRLSAAEAIAFRKRYGIGALATRLKPRRRNPLKAAKSIRKVSKKANPHLSGSMARLRQRSAPPALGVQARRAAALYQRFTKQKAEPFGYVDMPAAPKAAAIMGYCDAIEYTTQREGTMQLFRHKFHRKDAPLLCVGPTGAPILMVGGVYRWTDRGIVDRSDRKTR